MYQFSAIVIILSTLLISLSPLALAAALPFDQVFDKRDGQSGRGTWFDDGLGACGVQNSNSDSIVAISVDIYGTGAYCGRWVSITNTANEQTACGIIRDKCEGCGANDLDMSIGLFQQLGNLNTGVLPITWNIMPIGWAP